MTFFVDQTGGVTPTDVNGHGTHVAGIAVGNAATGDTDPQGFLLGQGMAPGANFGDGIQQPCGGFRGWLGDGSNVHGGMGRHQTPVRHRGIPRMQTR
jgi:subtilisin family serine protease